MILLLWVPPASVNPFPLSSTAVAMPLTQLTVEWVPGAHRQAIEAVEELLLHEPRRDRIALIAGFRAFVSLLARKDGDAVAFEADGPAEFGGYPLYFDPVRCWDAEVRAVSRGASVEQEAARRAARGAGRL